MSQDPGNDLSDMIGLFRGPFWPLAMIVIGIGAPLSEELLFRGFLQTALVPTRLGYWGASVVTTAIWTAMHAGYSIAGLVEVFMIGLMFTWFLRRTGSLRVSLVCHAIYNSGIAAILIFAPKDMLGYLTHANSSPDDASYFYSAVDIYFRHSSVPIDSRAAAARVHHADVLEM